MTIRPRPNPCENMNHRRVGSPVRNCPQCGGVVNASRPAMACTDGKHATARRRQSVFCVDCGSQLVFQT